MKYLRRNENGEAIFNCPDCGCELHASGEMLTYLKNDIMSQYGKITASKLTPEERKAKAIKAINTRWARVRANGTVPPTE